MRTDFNCKDLVVLTADKDMKLLVQGLLTRPEDLNIQPVSAEFFIHPEHDPGCLLRADDFLRPFYSRFQYAIVMFDREGCGREAYPAERLELGVKDRLRKSGWSDRASAIAIDPELENWVFSDSEAVDAALGWTGRNPSLRSWLKKRGYFKKDQSKPTRPKEAMLEALREVKIPRSSSIFGQLARNVNFEGCTDRAFLKFKNTLQAWFKPI